MATNENQKVFKRKELIACVDDHEVDFVARFSTSWHLLGIAAFLESIAGTDKELNGIICFSPGISSAHIMKVQDLLMIKGVKYRMIGLEKTSIRIKLFETARLLLRSKKLNETGKRIYLIGPHTGWYLFAGALNLSKYYPVLVEIDEGFASYNDRRQWILGALQETGSFLNTLITIVQFYALDLLKRLYKFKSIDYKLFHGKDKLSPNHDALNHYKNIISYSTPRKRISAGAPVSFLFLTQPLVEDNHISFENLQIFYKTLMDSGLDVHFKIHPRDKSTCRMQFLSDRILNDEGLNAEEFYYSLSPKPRYVIGFHSTSLISLHLFWNATTVSLNHVIMDKLSGKYIIDSFNNFEKLFNDQVVFIDSLNDLNELL